MRCYDFTQGFQLAGVLGMTPGLFLPGANPYLAGGVVYPPAFAHYLSAANYINGYSMLNWEPNVNETVSYGVGLATINSGIVTCPTANLPNTYAFNVIAGRLCIGNQYYEVASRNSATQLTLVNTSVNVPTPSAYKFTQWDFREIDPFYAFNDREWQFAHDEYAYALSQISSLSLANNAHVGLYEFVALTWRNGNRIIDDGNTGTYAAWQARVATVCNYVTSSGFRIVDWLRDRNGLVTWPNYVPHAYLDGAYNKNRWRIRNQRISATLTALNVPNAPLFLRFSEEGFHNFYATGSGELIDDAYQQEMASDFVDKAWWAGGESVAYGYPMAGYNFPATQFAQQMADASTSRRRLSAFGVSFHRLAIIPGETHDAAWRRDLAGAFGPLATESEGGEETTPPLVAGTNIFAGAGMEKNVAGQVVFAELRDAAGTAPYTGAVTVYVTGDANSQVIGSVGSGVATNMGRGVYRYLPSQAETNFKIVAYTFLKADGGAVTVQRETIARLVEVTVAAMETSEPDAGFFVNLEGGGGGSGDVNNISMNITETRP